MFCSSCGSSVAEKYNYCPKCGAKVTSPTTAQDVGSSLKTKLIPIPDKFNEFRTKKEQERASHFRPTKGKRKRPTEDVEEKVKINIGIMLFDGFDLKKQRGKSIAVELAKNSTKDVLLKASIDKHVAHSRDMVNPNHKYEILYSDGIIVGKLKESDEEFVLYKYKAECAKPYNRISFFLCRKIDYQQATLKSCLVSDSDTSVASGSESCNKEREAKSLSRQNDLSFWKKQQVESTIVNDIDASRNATVNIVNTAPDSSDPCSSESFTHIEVGPHSKKESQHANPGLVYASPVNVVDVPVDVHQFPHTPAFNTTVLSVDQESLCTTLMEMFPQLDEAQLHEALTKGNYDIELAVAHILSGLPTASNTPQQVYAALDFCNVFERSEECEETYNTNCESTSSTGTLEGSLTSGPLCSIIKDFSAGMFDPESPVRIKVRRSHVWEDAYFKLKRCSETDLNKLIKVQFVGEPAVDQGGPRNEFFSLLHREISSSSLLAGDTATKCFAHNVIALERKDYFLYGQLCSLGILQGSPSPSYFSSTVADYIVYGKLEKVSTNITDLPNSKARKKLQELQEISDPNTFKQAASFDCSLRFKAGYSKPIVSMEDKDDLIRCVSLHYSLLSGLVELEQFLDGLKLGGLLELLREHPTKARHLFMQSSENQLTAEKLDELFACILSPRGSNKRSAEEAIAVNFSRYLELVEANEAQSNLLDLVTGEETQITLSLSDILQFITDSSSVPPAGFNDEPSIVFEHEDPQRKLCANTCTSTLTLPVNNTLMEFESFKEEFTSCLVMSPGFGNV